MRCCLYCKLLKAYNSTSRGYAVALALHHVTYSASGREHPKHLWQVLPLSDLLVLRLWVVLLLQAHADPASITHGVIAARRLDARGHMAGDRLTGLGESGGGVFDAEDGGLIGMVTGAHEHTKMCTLVPALVLQTFANIDQEAKGIA